MSKIQTPKLNTTSYALLGLLNRRPWSAYELTSFMRNSILRAVWPRAESHLYSEPKLLQKRGFASSHEESHGARKRRVYTITEAGKAALREWLTREEASEFRFEYELLVRLAFVEAAGDEWVLRYLQQVHEEAIDDTRTALAAVEAMLADPEALAHNAGARATGSILLCLSGQLESRLRWAAEMQERLKGGVDSQEAEQLYRESSRRLGKLLEQA